MLGGEGYDWYYAPRRPRRAAAHPHHRRHRQALGVPLQGHPHLVAEPAFQPPRRRESRRADGVGAAVQADLVQEPGCPAVDKGANQPNVFVDPKSSESPPLLLARHPRRPDPGRYLQAFPTPSTGRARLRAGSIRSPASTGRMVDLEPLHIYAWDARPYPAFPYATSYWSDGHNWALGHWLNGRLGSASLDDLVSQILIEDFADSMPRR